MRSTASAPMSRASHTSTSLTVKSLRSTGSSTAARAAARSSGEPPKWSWSVRTDRQAAPPASYFRATAAGSRSGARSPFDGERRLISAMTATPVVAASERRNGRGGGVTLAASIRSSVERPSAAARSRWAATIPSR